MIHATKPINMNILNQLFVVMILLGVAPAFSWAEEPGQQRVVQERDPLLKSVVEGPRPQSSPESPQQWECPGPLSLVNLKAADIGEPQLRTNPDCLAAHYDFADFDPVTGCVRDKSGNGFDLTTVGKPADAVQGISGKAARLNGGYFQAKGNPLAGADHFTISVWFKTAEPLNNYKLVSAAVWSGGNNASGWNVGTHYCEFWADNQEGSLRGEPGWERNAEFRKGEWNHLVVSYDGAQVREYINGMQSAKILGTGRRVGHGVPMVVGAWMGSFQFHGELDELRIYRRALKKKEIQSLYKAPTNEQ
jgi:Concanavalin A-like lectin/glucanases superfamily